MRSALQPDVPISIPRRARMILAPLRLVVADADMLEVEIFEHSLAAMLIADTALLAAAIRRVHHAGIDIVDRDIAIVETRGEVAHLVHVLGVDIGGETV